MKRKNTSQPMRTAMQDKCIECNGIGKISDYEEGCRRCGGTGLESVALRSQLDELDRKIDHVMFRDGGSAADLRAERAQISESLRRLAVAEHQL